VVDFFFASRGEVAIKESMLFPELCPGKEAASRQRGSVPAGFVAEVGLFRSIALFLIWNSGTQEKS